MYTPLQSDEPLLSIVHHARSRSRVCYEFLFVFAVVVGSPRRYGNTQMKKMSKTIFVFLLVAQILFQIFSFADILQGDGEMLKANLSGNFVSDDKV